MGECPSCGGRMCRSHRGWGERLLFTAAFRCETCKLRFRVSWWTQWRQLRFASCPRCGGFDLTVKSKRDRIDNFDRNPLRLAQRMLGAPLYYCWICRLQFRDIRPRRPAEVMRPPAP